MLAAVNRKLVGVSPFSRVSPFSIPRFIPTPLHSRILPRSFPHERGVVDRTSMRGKRGVWRSGASGQRIRNAGIASTRTKRRRRGEAGGIKQAHGYTVMRQCISG